jgi:hypothetical protein
LSRRRTATGARKLGCAELRRRGCGPREVVLVVHDRCGPREVILVLERVARGAGVEAPPPGGAVVRRREGVGKASSARAAARPLADAAVGEAPSASAAAKSARALSREQHP